MDLESLNPEFREKVLALISKVKDEGITVVPYFFLRDPWEQAKLWRQSRTHDEVVRTGNSLRALNANFIADCLLSVGPQPTRPWATNALPGLSWHQWGEAADFYVSQDGRAVWNARHPGYEILASEAEKLGLTTGYYWNNQDPGHIQTREGRVLDLYQWPEIDREMRTRFVPPVAVHQ